MKAYERLLKYVVVRTPSDETSDLSHPPNVSLILQASLLTS